MQTRPIPSSGEALPVIGCGTYVGFDVGADGEKLKALADVVRTLRDAGGKVFDSSPMYGRAEAVLGDLLAGAPDPERTFIATKVWTRGRQAGITQMERSFALLKVKRIDLMQVHNLLDWETHLGDAAAAGSRTGASATWASRITPRAPMTSWKP